MARIRRRYKHKFLTENIQVNDNRVLNGMVVTFLYQAPKVYDPTPNVFVLNFTKELMQGINLNYLPASTCTDLFRRVKNLAQPVIENKVQAAADYTRFEMNSRYTPSAVDGKFLWNRIKINKGVYKAHRSYKRVNMGALQIRQIEFGQLGLTVNED